MGQDSRSLGSRRLKERRETWQDAWSSSQPSVSLPSALDAAQPRAGNAPLVEQSLVACEIVKVWTWVTSREKIKSHASELKPRAQELSGKEYLDLEKCFLDFIFAFRKDQKLDTLRLNMTMCFRKLPVSRRRRQEGCPTGLHKSP